MTVVRQHLVLARMGGAAWEDVVTVLATLLGRQWTMVLQKVPSEGS